MSFAVDLCTPITDTGTSHSTYQVSNEEERFPVLTTDDRNHIIIGTACIWE